MVQLCPALRDRPTPYNFYPLQTWSAMDGASFVSNKDNASFRRKLVGKNCTDAIFTRFPVLARLTARGPSVPAGRLRPPTIGARLLFVKRRRS